jgi:hypothetical protein
MIKPQRNKRLSRLLSSAIISASLCSPTGVFTATLEEHQWARPVLVPLPVRQEKVIVQHFVDKDLSGCCDAVVPTQEQPSIPLAPIHWQAREQLEDSTDQPESSPPSDLPPPPDPEPEPYANVPVPTVPPSVHPKSTQPGLLLPPMPEPSAPHLAPPPPPMPEPAEPPPLSQRPDLNPANPGAPEPPPTPAAPQAEPTMLGQQPLEASNR